MLAWADEMTKKDFSQWEWRIVKNVSCPPHIVYPDIVYKAKNVLF